MLCVGLYLLFKKGQALNIEEQSICHQADKVIIINVSPEILLHVLRRSHIFLHHFSKCCVAMKLKVFKVFAQKLLVFSTNDVCEMNHRTNVSMLWHLKSKIPSSG